MIKTITILFSILVLITLLNPASAQSSLADYIVINEVEINPPGDDSFSPSEWVELYNPTSSDVDIGGWKIASTSVLKQTLTISPGTIIKAGDFLTYSYKTVWFTDINEIVELRDENNIVIDSTLLMSDIKNDFTSWQRVYDGVDNNSAIDWKFEKSNAGSSNGKAPIADDIQNVIVTINSIKQNYLFGETAILQGHVSEKVFINQHGDFKAASIMVEIRGPNYSSDVLLYPDLNLDFKTSLKLNSVLGINEGVYNVTVRYVDSISSTTFSVGDEIIESDIPEQTTFGIFTDGSQYLPGDTILITGSISKTIPFEGLRYELRDPDGKMVEFGTLYPTDGKVSAFVFLTTVNPVYGTYVLTGEYSDKTSTTSFELVKDVKEDTLISLWTDNEVYGVGDTVSIFGRLNDLWVSSLDLEILQTKNTALGVKDFAGGDLSYKILDVVRLEGDGSFQYSFQIPPGEQRLGDYKIKVSKEIGTAIKVISVVKDPSNYVERTEPLTIFTDKPVYDFGDKIIISGFIENLSQSTSTVPVVNVSIKDGDGKTLSMIGDTGGGRLGSTGSAVSYDFTAIPDKSGRFEVSTQLNRSIFDEGQYLVTVKYLKLTKSVPFSVTDSLDTVGQDSLFLNKDIFGLGETIFLTGSLPPTSDTSVSIALTKPDGSASIFGALVENQQFSWSWVTPIIASQPNLKSDDRSLSSTNLGIYKIRISAPSFGENLYFKVSLNPTNDSFSISPVDVSTAKPIYEAGETLKVLGSVILREQGSEGLVIPERVHLSITSEKSPTKIIHEASVYPDGGGSFQSNFELPITIFSEGQYKVKAIYTNKQTTTSFGVVNDFTHESDEPLSLLVSSDKSQYYPGDEVFVVGKPNKLIYLENYDVSVFKKTGSEITCGSFTCGVHDGPITTIRPSPNGSFSYQFSIPDSTESIGRYEVTVEADFETKSLQFDVVEKPIEENIPQTIIEKVNSIPEDHISIIVTQRDYGDTEIGPRVLLGSLITSPRGEEPNVNLRVVSESGVCVIGPEDNCLVQDSTRKPGEIYDIVEVDGISLKVRYSGPDVVVEKFSILPESSTAMLPDSVWDIQVVKDDQQSRLYYKINYSSLE
jgi:hypothetical protein